MTFLHTLPTHTLFPGTENQIQAVLRSKNATEVYRLGGDVYYKKI
jgi:hypothetical protein